MTSDVTYDFLPVAEQRSEIESRLVSVEREHLRAALNVETAGANATPEAQAELDRLTASMTALKARLESLPTA